MTRTLLIAGAALAALASPAFAAEYVTIDMEVDVNASAQDLWAAVGDYCDIEEWGGLACEITSGDGGVGTVRALTIGQAHIDEILVGQTELS